VLGFELGVPLRKGIPEGGAPFQKRSTQVTSQSYHPIEGVGGYRYRSGRLGLGLSRRASCCWSLLLGKRRPVSPNSRVWRIAFGRVPEGVFIRHRLTHAPSVNCSVANQVISTNRCVARFFALTHVILKESSLCQSHRVYAAIRMPYEWRTGEE